MVDAAGLETLAQTMRGELAQQQQDGTPSTNTPQEDDCLGKITSATSNLFAEERQTMRLAKVDMYSGDPIDEQMVASQLFDELRDAQTVLQITHQMVQLTEAYCNRSQMIAATDLRLEATEGEYQRIVSTLQERIGATRPELAP
ncbi:MAG TPA: hypothetical protein VHW60_00470 [Caulobacteraceae bacterium]|nr:hypothetical protein [Caulobacteraceae bacterium]